MSIWQDWGRAWHFAGLRFRRARQDTLSLDHLWQWLTGGITVGVLFWGASTQAERRTQIDHALAFGLAILAIAFTRFIGNWILAPSRVYEEKEARIRELEPRRERTVRVVVRARHAWLLFRWKLRPNTVILILPDVTIANADPKNSVSIDYALRFTTKDDWSSIHEPMYPMPEDIEHRDLDLSTLKPYGPYINLEGGKSAGPGAMVFAVTEEELLDYAIHHEERREFYAVPCEILIGDASSEVPFTEKRAHVPAIYWKQLP